MQISLRALAHSKAWAALSIWQGPAISAIGKWLPKSTPPTETMAAGAGIIIMAGPSAVGMTPL
jgi:hypothetical protein